MEPSVKNLLLLLSFAFTGLASFVTVPASPVFSKTYTYELIPEKNTLRYAIQELDTWHVVYTGVEGSFQFHVDGGGAIVSKKFDLTITGPFHDSLLEPVDSAPFAPGDALADFLAVDFANTTGLKVPSIPLNGVQEPYITETAYVGPDVVGGSNMDSLGKSHYHINQLEIDPAIFFFHAEARTEVGGFFSIFPPTDPSTPTFPFMTFSISFQGEEDSPNPIYLAPDNLELDYIAMLLPNVRLVPEPASIALLGLAASALGLVGRRRFLSRSWR